MRYNILVLVFEKKLFIKKLKYLYGVENRKMLDTIFEEFSKSRYHVYFINTLDAHKEALFHKTKDIIFNIKEIQQIDKESKRRNFKKIFHLQ